MGKTYKDREKVGRPRVPDWLRPPPEKIHRDKKKDPPRQKDQDYYDGRHWTGSHDWDDD